MYLTQVFLPVLLVRHTVLLLPMVRGIRPLQVTRVMQSSILRQQPLEMLRLLHQQLPQIQVLRELIGLLCSFKVIVFLKGWLFCANPFF